MVLFRFLLFITGLQYQMKACCHIPIFSNDLGTSKMFAKSGPVDAVVITHLLNARTIPTRASKNLVLHMSTFRKSNKCLDSAEHFKSFNYSCNLFCYILAYIDAANCFRRFNDSWDDPEAFAKVGEEFRKLILEPGAGQDNTENLKKFLKISSGKSPHSMQALLDYQGWS